MAKKVKVVRPKRFHLYGHNNQNPVLNLAGGRETSADKIHVDEKKLAWAKAYTKAAALYSDQNPEDQNRYWQDKRFPDGNDGGQPVSRDERRLAAGTLSQESDPEEVVKAEQNRYEQLSRLYSQLSPAQRAQFEPPRMHYPAVSGTPDNPQFEPNILNSAAHRAEADKLRALGSRQVDPSMPHAGAAGLTDPFFQAISHRAGALGPAAVGMLPAMSDALAGNGVVDKRGKLTPDASVGNPVDEAQALRTDRNADLVHDYYAAVQNGDEAKAQSVGQQLQEQTGFDPRQVADAQQGRRNFDQSINALGGQTANIISAPAFANPATSITPLIAAPLIGAAASAWHAQPGDRLRAAWAGANQTLADPSLHQSLLTGGATGAALRGLSQAAPSLAPTTLGSRIVGGLRTLANPAAFARGGAIAGGIQGIRDLYDYTTDAGAARMGAEVRQQTMANENRSTVGKILSAGDAGIQVGLGNLAPARAQVGAALGRYDLAKDLPMGRAYREAHQQLAVDDASRQGHDQTLQMLKLDPRFASVDPGLLEHLATESTRNASTAEAVKQQGGEGNQWLQQFTDARNAYLGGKATPQHLELLSELAQGKPENGQFSPDQMNMASRNAMLYHRFNRSDAQQLMQGNVPYQTEQGSRAYASNVIPYAAGQSPDEWRSGTTSKPQVQPQLAAPAKPAAPVAQTPAPSPAPAPTAQLPATPTIPYKV